MESQDYPVVHFERMRDLTRALQELPAQILAHEYLYESFGSWYVTLRYSGCVAQLVYDGREGSLALRRSADRKPPYGFGPDEWEASGVGARDLDQTTIKEICSAIVGSP
jgi:hypothetical protein